MTSVQLPLPPKAQTLSTHNLPNDWPSSSFPSRKTIADNNLNSKSSVLQKTADCLREVVAHVRRLNASPYVLKRLFAMTGDLWKSPSGADMFALQFTTIKKDFTAHEARLMQFEPVSTTKTGQNLASVVTDHARAEKMNDLLEHVAFAVLDGASNNKTMVEALEVAMHLKLTLVHCYAHRMNLVCKNAMALLTSGAVSAKARAAARRETLDGADADVAKGDDDGGGDDDEEAVAVAAADFIEIEVEFEAVLQAKVTSMDEEDEAESLMDEEDEAESLDLTERQELHDLLDLLFGWAQTYQTSSSFKNALHKARKNLPVDVRKKGLVARCATRWSASFQCLLRISELWESVKVVTEDSLTGGKNYGYQSQSKTKHGKVPSGESKVMLSELVAIMRVADESMVSLQSAFMPAGQA
jgi:hypothetical protein